MSREAPVDQPAASPAPPSDGDAGTAEAPAGLLAVPVDAIRPNPHQPRKSFDETALGELAASIRSAGVMQPVVLRRDAAGEGWELVAGERRWRAARQAGLETIPALVRDLADHELAEWALIENLQREDLNPIERAEAFGNLADAFGLDHGAIAERVGVNRVTVTNALRLLTLHPDVQALVRDGRLSNGQAKALAGIEDHDRQAALARRAVDEDWSVRALEAAVRDGRGAAGEEGETGEAERSRPERPHRLVDLEQQIAEQLQTKVTLKPGRRKGTGALTIRFFTLDQFDGLLDRLGVETD
jgi:ParB family chromosome partitioning protein